MANDVINEISVLILDPNHQQAIEAKFRELFKTLQDPEAIDWWSESILESGTPGSDRFRVTDDFDGDNVILSAWGPIRYLPRQLCHQLHSIDPSVIIRVYFKEEFAQIVGVSLTTYCDGNINQISFYEDASEKVGSYLEKRDAYLDKDKEEKAEQFQEKADLYIDKVLERCEKSAWKQVYKILKRRPEDFTHVV